MRCEPFQNAISARIDGEDPGLPIAAIDDHLTGCATCRGYEAGAARLHRRVRVRAAEPVPDLSAAILAAAPRPHVAPARAPQREWARYVLLVVALTQLAVALPGIVLGDQAGATVHLARELGSWDVALGSAWLLVAWSPRRAAGMLPFTAVLALVMVVTSALDIVDGRALMFGEAHHVLDIVGLVMIWLLAHAAPSDRSLLAFGQPRTNRVAA